MKNVPEGKKGKPKQLKLFGSMSTGNVALARPANNGQQLIGLKKEHSYFHDLARRLMEFAEKDELEFEDGVNKPYIRAGNLIKVFRAIHREVDDNLDTLKNLGFLQPKETSPEGWYICPDGYEVELLKPLNTRELRRLALQLYKLPGYKEMPDTQRNSVRQHSKTRIISWLMQQGEVKPQEVLDQLVMKNYLIPADATAEPTSFIVCQTQAEGRST